MGTGQSSSRVIILVIVEINAQKPKAQMCLNYTKTHNGHGGSVYQQRNIQQCMDGWVSSIQQRCVGCDDAGFLPNYSSPLIIVATIPPSIIITSVNTNTAPH